MIDDFTWILALLASVVMQVLFRCSLAFLKHLESELLAINDSAAIYVFMQKLGQRMSDVNTIFQVWYWYAKYCKI